MPGSDMNPGVVASSFFQNPNSVNLYNQTSYSYIMTVKVVIANEVGAGAIRVTIPREFCGPANIAPGTTLSVRRRGQEIIFKKVSK